MPFVNPVRNPFDHRECPFCFEKFHLGECPVWSSINNFEMDPAPRSLWKKGLRRVVPIRLIGNEKYLRELARRKHVSKGQTCDQLVPLNMDYPGVKNYIIAIIGATSSGKSHYIATLIKEIVELAQPLIRYQQFTADGPTRKDYNDNYYVPLYVERKEMGNTRLQYDPIRRPLVYQMILPPSGLDASVKNINLLFYDAAGEQIVNQDQAVVYSRYLYHASAIIFLADPQKMDGIANRLPYHLRLDPAAAGGGPQRVDRAIDVLDSVLDLIRQKRGLQPGERIDIPLAVTLSKSDLLKSVQGLANPPHFLNKPPAFYQKAAMYQDLRPLRSAMIQDLWNIQKEVYNFIRDFGGDQPLLYVNNRVTDTNVGYFAISATGHALQPDGTYPAIEPIRCLDPFMWVLFKLRILEGWDS